MLDSIVLSALLLPAGRLDPTGSHRHHVNTGTLYTTEDRPQAYLL